VARAERESQPVGMRAGWLLQLFCISCFGGDRARELPSWPPNSQIISEKSLPVDLPGPLEKVSILLGKQEMQGLICWALSVFQSYLKV